MYVPLLTDLVTAGTIDAQVSLIKEICRLVHEDLLRSGVITGEQPNEWLLPLLNDHNELRRRLVATIQA